MAEPRSGFQGRFLEILCCPEAPSGTSPFKGGDLRARFHFPLQNPPSSTRTVTCNHSEDNMGGSDILFCSFSGQIAGD